MNAQASTPVQFTVGSATGAYGAMDTRRDTETLKHYLTEALLNSPALVNVVVDRNNTDTHLGGILTAYSIEENPEIVNVTLMFNHGHHITFKVESFSLTSFTLTPLNH